MSARSSRRPRRSRNARAFSLESEVLAERRRRQQREGACGVAREVKRRRRDDQVATLIAVSGVAAPDGRLDRLGGDLEGIVGSEAFPWPRA